MPPPKSSQSTSSFINRVGKTVPGIPLAQGPIRSISGKSAPFGLGQGVAGPRRHRKVLRDNIMSITRPDIRRLARRGGVKRISAGVYVDVRHALKLRLAEILKECSAITDHCKRKTVTVTDVIFVLKRLGRPIYGFDPVSYQIPKRG